MKKGFSLIELGFAIFLITAVIFVIVPFSISNIKQAKRVIDWKDYMSQAQYSYETLLEYKKTNPLSQKESVEKLMNYLDAKKTNFDDSNIKNYKYKMLNSGLFKKYALNDFDEVYTDIKNRIIFVSYNKSLDEDDIWATVCVDLNGTKIPNRIGKDIFIYKLSDNSAEPYGKGTNTDTLKKDCSITGTGMMCSEYYILGGEFR